MKHNNNSIETSTDNDYLYITDEQKVTHVYSVYLFEEISDQKYYKELFAKLRDSNEEDKFLFYMNNFGGLVHTGIDIINAMRAAPAKVCACITGPIYSMAPLIALSAEQIYVQEDSFFMFHDYSGGTYGKGNEQLEAIKHHKPHFDNLFRNVTKGFLSKKEIDGVLKGADLYIDNKDIIKRLKKLGKLGNE